LGVAIFSRLFEEERSWLTSAGKLPIVRAERLIPRSWLLVGDRKFIKHECKLTALPML
jgi:hypothetical protein